MNKNHFYKFEVVGIFFTFITGIILQLAFNFTDGAAWTIILASVNHSLWEECKVFALPYLAWAVITLAVSRPHFKAFFVSKIAGLYTIVFGSLFVCCLLNGIIGQRLRIVEIIVFLLFVVLGYIVSSNLAVNENLHSWFVTSLFALILFVVSYFCFTYSPPEVGIFFDSENDVYGVPASEYQGDIYLDAMYSSTIISP